MIEHWGGWSYGGQLNLNEYNLQRLGRAGTADLKFEESFEISLMSGVSPNEE